MRFPKPKFGSSEIMKLWKTYMTLFLRAVEEGSLHQNWESHMKIQLTPTNEDFGRDLSLASSLYFLYINLSRTLLYMHIYTYTYKFHIHIFNCRNHIGFYPFGYQFNTLYSNDVIYGHRTISPQIQVMVCCLFGTQLLHALLLSHR